MFSEYATVLTEHVGKENTTIKDEKKYSEVFEEHIYLRDTDWIRQSDVIVAEVTIPSLGVGYEIGYAESLGKKILCIYSVDGDKKVSCMIIGNSKLEMKSYRNLDEAKEIIKEYLENIK